MTVQLLRLLVRFRLCWNFGMLMDRHSRAGGNLEFQCLKNLSEKTKTLPPSFPRKWESRNEKQQDLSEMTEIERTGFPLLRE
ncbi:hypothetical protein, partial [Neisseria meningitidis]|uniref:hypothetical protein n=1 Tax=Neisseria meningitidis TaxID=487 RepID=UPI0039F685A2